MDRRSFVLSLFGGLAAAGVGGAAFARGAEPRTAAAEPRLPAEAGEIDAATRAGLDEADADFTQVVVRRRPVRRRRGPYRRRVIVRRPPVVRRRVIVRRRRPIVRRRVIIR